VRRASPGAESDSAMLAELSQTLRFCKARVARSPCSLCRRVASVTRKKLKTDKLTQSRPRQHATPDQIAIEEIVYSGRIVSPAVLTHAARSAGERLEQDGILGE
jgi:hypothetical protein